MTFSELEIHALFQLAGRGAESHAERLFLEYLADRYNTQRAKELESKEEPPDHVKKIIEMTQAAEVEAVAADGRPGGTYPSNSGASGDQLES